MKRLIIACICSIALAMGLFAQAPATSPTPSAAATAPVTASVSPSDLADRIQQKLELPLPNINVLNPREPMNKLTEKMSPTIRSTDDVVGVDANGDWGLMRIQS